MLLFQVVVSMHVLLWLDLFDKPNLFYRGKFTLFLLTEQGYRVLVVEQTETPEQLELRRKEKGAKDKVCCTMHDTIEDRLYFYWFSIFYIFPRLAI